MMRGGVRLVAVGDDNAWGVRLAAVDVFLLLPSVWQAEMSLQLTLMCFIFRKFTTLSSSVDVSSCGASVSVSTVVLVDVARAYVWCLVSRPDMMTSSILVYCSRSSIWDSRCLMGSFFSSMAFCSTFTI